MPEPFPSKPVQHFTAAELHTWLHASLTRLEKALGADDRAGIQINRINARRCFEGFKARHEDKKGRRGPWDKNSYGRYTRLKDAALQWLKDNPEPGEETE